MVGEARAAEEAARDGASAPQGSIRVAAPMSFGVANVAPLLAEFLVQHPAVDIDLQLSDARVDIIGEGFDIALRIGDLADSSLRARRLCSIATHIVAAPAYLAAAGEPHHAGDLAGHRLLRYANIAGNWRFHGPGGAEVSIRPEGPLIANSGDALVPALLAGLGIAPLPGFIVGPHISSGALVPILTDWTPPPVGLHLLTPPSALRPQRVEALIAFIAERLRDPCARA
jgi:DNA-binding transcriptional LysR family regulator